MEWRGAARGWLGDRATVVVKHRRGWLGLE